MCLGTTSYCYEDHLNDLAIMFISLIMLSAIIVMEQGIIITGQSLKKLVWCTFVSILKSIALSSLPKYMNYDIVFFCPLQKCLMCCENVNHHWESYPGPPAEAERQILPLSYASSMHQ